MAGHNHEPFGILATTSTLPYLIDLDPLVVRRALRTGFMIAPDVTLLRMEHSLMPLVVQVPSVVRFSTKLS